MEGKVLTWRKFNFWDQILSPPHILGTISACFETVIERTGQIQGKTCVLQGVCGIMVVPALSNTPQTL